MRPRSRPEPPQEPEEAPPALGEPIMRSEFNPSMLELKRIDDYLDIASRELIECADLTLIPHLSIAVKALKVVFITLSPLMAVKDADILRGKFRDLEQLLYFKVLDEYGQDDSNKLYRALQMAEILFEELLEVRSKLNLGLRVTDIGDKYKDITVR